MIQAVLFDLGGVMVAPPTGDWLLVPGYEDILGDDFAEKLGDFRRMRAPHLPLLPDLYCVGGDDDAEYRQFIVYFDRVFSEMGIHLTRAQLEELAYRQVFRDDRYTFFDDVMPHLRKWHGRYKLGIVSDAPPSTRRIMRTAGVLALMDGATFSCDFGVLKPDPRMYQSTLDQMGVLPENAVFIDDLSGNVRGAVQHGLHGIQMRRQMPALYKMPMQWDGPVAHSFAELDKMLAEM